LTILLLLSLPNYTPSTWFYEQTIRKTGWHGENYRTNLAGDFKNGVKVVLTQSTSAKGYIQYQGAIEK
jgi:hypothetical protein